MKTLATYLNNRGSKMMDESRELILISKGNELAFDGFMDRHSQNMYNHAFGILGDKEQAEEIVSDVFFEVWKMRKKLLGIENINSWLCTVVYRKSVSQLRKESRRRKSVSIDDVSNFVFPQMETPMDSMISAEEMRGLNEAIEQLPAKCKHVFYLAKIERMPYADICDMLSISLATVNYHVSYALAALRKRLKAKA